MKLRIKKLPKLILEKLLLLLMIIAQDFKSNSKAINWTATYYQRKILRIRL